MQILILPPLRPLVCLYFASCSESYSIISVFRNVIKSRYLVYFDIDLRFFILETMQQEITLLDALSVNTVYFKVLSVIKILKYYLISLLLHLFFYVQQTLRGSPLMLPKDHVSLISQVSYMSSI